MGDEVVGLVLKVRGGMQECGGKGVLRMGVGLGDGWLLLLVSELSSRCRVFGIFGFGFLLVLILSNNRVTTPRESQKH